jgi:hypothetical protein
MPWSDWLGALAQRHPDQIAVIDAASRRSHTYRSFDNRANQIAHFCERWVGLLPGDRLGLLSTPSDDVLQIIMAAGKLGLTALLLDPAAAPDALIQNINQYSPRTVFHGLAQADLVRAIWFKVDSVEHFIPLRGKVDTANFEDIAAHYPPTPPFREIEENVPWVCFANDGITWPTLEDVAGYPLPGEGLGAVAGPLYRPAGLATGVVGLKSSQCVVVEGEAVRVIESPPEMSPGEEHRSDSQRNVPTGPSWLPHEFL